MQDIYKNNAGQEYIILDRYNRRIKNRIWPMLKIQFLDSGTTKEVYECNAKLGKVLDPYFPSFLGIGYQGIHPKPSYWKEAKRLWSNMMKRCYDQNYTDGYYGRGYKVDKRWHCFANFLEDIPKLENFEYWVLGGNQGFPNYNLDKDLKYPGNKIYSLECCSFVTEYENKSHGAKRARELDKIKKMGKN